jgi:hypothetical protein
VSTDPGVAIVEANSISRLTTARGQRANPNINIPLRPIAPPRPHDPTLPSTDD